MPVERTTRRVQIRGWSDLVTGLISLPAIAFLANETRSFQVVDWAPLGMAFWPRVLLGIWFVLSVILIVQGFRRPSEGSTLEIVASIPVILGIAFLLVVPFLGMLGPLWVLVAVFGFLRRDRRDFRAVLTSAISASFVTLAIYLLFGVLLDIQLPHMELRK